MSRIPTSKHDRRSGSDRRREQRFALQQNVVWEGSSGLWEGMMSDISSSGCFVLGPGDVVDGDRVRIDLPLLAGGTVSFWAEVVNNVYEIGYGARFVGLSDAQRSYLETFTDTLRAD
jgi:hypothetical protein